MCPCGGCLRGFESRAPHHSGCSIAANALRQLIAEIAGSSPAIRTYTARRRVANPWVRRAAQKGGVPGGGARYSFIIRHTRRVVNREIGTVSAMNAAEWGGVFD